MLYNPRNAAYYQGSRAKKKVRRGKKYQMGLNDDRNIGTLDARRRRPSLGRRQRCRNHHRLAFLESLEARAMLSASPGASQDIENPFDWAAEVHTVEQPLTPLSATAAADISLLGPPGSLVGQFASSGELNESNPIDEISISIEAEQRLTVVAEASDSLQVMVTLLDEAGETVLTGAGLDPGSPVVIQSFLIPNSGQYSVTVEGGDGTSGTYDLRFYLNAAVELESVVNLPNDSAANSESLNGGFINLDGSDASRVAVVATRGVDLEEGFETGILNDEWSTSSSDAEGRIRLWTDVRAAEGNYSLIMDVGTPGVSNGNQADWSVDLSGLTASTLRFAHTDYDDKVDVLPESFTNLANGDGVAISQDGVEWFRVWQGTDVPFGEWEEVSVDLAAAAATAGISLDGNLFIRFQQFGSGSFRKGGRGFDDIEVVAVPDFELEDWYRFSLDDGQVSSLVLESTAMPRGSLELYDDAETLLATSSAGQNADQFLQNFVDTTVDGGPNEYFVAAWWIHRKSTSCWSRAMRVLTRNRTAGSHSARI